MRELNFMEAGRLEWLDAAEPRLDGDGEAIVRPVAVATCDLDKLLVRGIAPGRRGRSPSGTRASRRCSRWATPSRERDPGDLVSVPFQVSCGDCATCRRGYTGNCERVELMSMYGLPMGKNCGGFLSDAVRVPFADAMLVAGSRGHRADLDRQPLRQHPRRLAHGRATAGASGPARRC